MSGQIIFGDLPPNSSVTRLICLPASDAINFPTSVEPLKFKHYFLLILGN